jgi:hypothetical protein
LTPDEFRRAISNGLGRVIVYLQTHDAGPYREIIREACLHGGGYDRQIEGSHSDYLFDIIKLTDEKDYYRDAVLEALRNATEQGWGMVHLMDLAKYFAMDGDDGARQAMYDKFTAELENDYWVGGRSIIEASGVDGFLFIADKLGQLALEDDEFEDDDDYYWDCLKYREPEVPEVELRAALEVARTENPRVDAYLKSIDGYREERDKRSEKRKRRKNRTKYPYEKVREAIQKHSSNEKALFKLSWLRMWGKNASEDQLVQAAEDLLTEEDEAQLISYMRIFEWVPFPLDCAKLLNIVQHGDHIPAYAAKKVLANTADVRIRQVALKMIEEKSRLDLGVAMLSSNFEAGDWSMIETLVSSQLDRDTFHSLCMAVREVFKQNHGLEGIGSLLNIYENTPCGVCRSAVVDLMKEVGGLPTYIAEEYQHDSYRLSR